MASLKLIFERQWLHALCLGLLLYGLCQAVELEQVSTGAAWGRDTLFWLWLGVGISISHQVLVWFVWRLQLHGQYVTRCLGAAGFPLYAVLFALLGIGRVLPVFIVAYANQGTLPGDGVLMKLVAVILLLPSLYLFYSVKRYFGFKRAFGADHFEEDYHTMPFVRRGIFRFTSNGMYIYGFLLLWVPALWWGSAAALCLAAFNHLYIWVHYYGTELPDIKRIYGSPTS